LRSAWSQTINGPAQSERAERSQKRFLASALPEKALTRLAELFSTTAGAAAQKGSLEFCRAEAEFSKARIEYEPRDDGQNIDLGLLETVTTNSARGNLTQLWASRCRTVCGKKISRPQQSRSTNAGDGAPQFVNPLFVVNGELRTRASYAFCWMNEHLNMTPAPQPEGAGPTARGFHTIFFTVAWRASRRLSDAATRNG